MIAAPVDDDEAKMTEVPNNGHAMAPYMTVSYTHLFHHKRVQKIRYDHLLSQCSVQRM